MNHKIISQKQYNANNEKTILTKYVINNYYLKLDITRYYIKTKTNISTSSPVSHQSSYKEKAFHKYQQQAYRTSDRQNKTHRIPNTSQASPQHPSTRSLCISSTNTPSNQLHHSNPFKTNRPSYLRTVETLLRNKNRPPYHRISSTKLHHPVNKRLLKHIFHSEHILSPKNIHP